MVKLQVAFIPADKPKVLRKKAEDKKEIEHKITHEIDFVTRKSQYATC